MSNIVKALLSIRGVTKTRPIYRYDYGMVLKPVGIKLPDSYEVHFSNHEFTDKAKRWIGNEDGCIIPDEYLESGDVWAFIFLHTGADDGETEFKIHIPVIARPKAIDTEPTPVQQDVITQTIAALNVAVGKAESAVAHYPKIENDYWYVWDADEGEFINTGIKAIGEDGTSVSVTVSTITGGHRVIITDADGDHVFDVLDGTIGQDGFSPIITVTNITGGHRVTITDAEGTQSFDVLDGSGVPGYFGICESAYGATTKIVPCEGFELVEGARIIVRFTAPEDTSINVGSIKLNVNSTGGKYVKYKNSTGGVSTIGKTFCDYRTYEFVYDGTYYIVVGDFDTDTTYYQMTQSEADTGTSVTGRLISAKVLHNAILNAGGSVTVDDELSTTSENPVQNKVITEELNSTKADLSELSSSIAPVETSTTATAAHAVGELFLVGETLMVALSAIAIGDTITTEGGSPNAAVTKLTDKLLKDVQVNGTSVVTDGVANVPIATNNTAGVIKVEAVYGLDMRSDGIIRINSAADGNIKSGDNSAKPIVSSNQHKSVFYGLAKAASDTTQSASSNAVGTYTDAAKIAIQKMLGIYEAPWELIADVTSTEDAGKFEVGTDINGQPFQLKKGIVYVEAPHTTTGTRDYIAASWRGVNSGGEESTLIFPNIQWVSATASTLFYYEFDCNGVTPQRTSAIAASGFGSTASYNQTANYINANPASYLKRFNLLQYNNNSSRIPSGTRIRIYGQRYVQ